MQDLYDTLHQRRRPEDIAEMIRAAFAADMTQLELLTLDRAASGSLKRGITAATSMLEDFHRPVTPEQQVRRAVDLFRRAEAWSAAECADPARVRAFLEELCPLIGKAFGESDFKQHRLNDEARAARGMDLSRRRYNKLFRLLARLEAKLRTYEAELRKFDFTRVGKSRLATRLPYAEFAADPATAAFVAYFVARCNLRSVFTDSAQQRPYDEVADMLFQRLARHEGRTNWWAVAHVHPISEVLARLPDARKGELLGTWLVLLRDIAGLLRDVWRESNIDRDTMIVRRGNDSTTWNNTANAWNRARDAWVALVQSIGMGEQLDAWCPGKVLRLMAADVAAWHRAGGGGLDPDALVWRDLPPPWEVVAGEATCTRQEIEYVCRRHGVDPVKRGWTAPPPGRVVEPFTPTPELVHGVAVADPELAKVLRRAGWFSGRPARVVGGVSESVNIRRDASGFAVGVDPA